MDKTINIGLDIGYSSTKCKFPMGMFRVLSVIGSPNYSEFGISSASENVITTKDGTFLVGDTAVAHSRNVFRREDRNWIESDTYYALMVYAIARALRGCEGTEYETSSVNVVTGLPISYFSNDSKKLIDVMKQNGGLHEYELSDGVKRTLFIDKVRVVPQPFGTIFSFAIDDNGNIIPEVAGGRTGVIDIGGKTTNILSTIDMSEKTREATSVNVGGWDATRMLRDYIVQKYPDIEMRDQELEQIMMTNTIMYYGEQYDLTDIVQSVANSIASQIKSEITQRWGSVASFDRIFITGGGANLIGEQLAKDMPQSSIVKNPVLANSGGYYKYANFVWKENIHV